MKNLAIVALVSALCGFLVGRLVDGDPSSTEIRSAASEFSSPRAELPGGATPTTKPESNPGGSRLTNTPEGTGIDIRWQEFKLAKEIEEKAHASFREFELSLAEYSGQSEEDGAHGIYYKLQQPDLEKIPEVVEMVRQKIPHLFEADGTEELVQRMAEDYFDYERKFRYVSFVKGDEDGRLLPTLIVRESDRDMPESEMFAQGTQGTDRVIHFTDLELSSPELERYAHFFTIE